MIVVNAIGVLGNLLFGYACLPTAYRTWRAGRSIGTPVNLAWNIMCACIAFYAYVLLKFGPDPIITATGGAEIAAYAVVLRYHYFPRGG